MQRSSSATLIALTLTLALPLSAQGPSSDSTHTAATPFGFHQGTPIAKLEAMGATLVKGQVGIYQVATAPEGYPDFGSYMLVASAKQGLCKVVAFSNDIQTNVFGEQVESEFKTLEAAVAAKYGKHKRVDRVRAGSLWTDPQDFMMGLLQKDRVLSALWRHDTGAKLPANLQGVSLDAGAQSTTTAYIELSYWFANFPKCQAEIQKAERSVF